MANKTKLNILVLTNDTASRKWRFDGIADRFHKYTDHEMYITSWANWNGDTVGADLVIMEMLTSSDMVRVMHDQGAKVIFEADDAFIDTYGREKRKNLTHITEPRREESIKTVAACDAVTVTNKTLADNFARFTDKPVYVLPNYLDFDWYGHDKLNIRRTTDEIRLGWFGSKGHFEDLRMVLPAIKNVLAKYPNVRFIYCGYGGASSTKGSTELGYGEDVFREIPRSQREFYPPTNTPDIWVMKHKTLDIDIGIAPLIDDYFNHCKSHIKWMEYAVTGAPAVVSPVVYTEHPSGVGSAVVDGKTALVAHTTADWEKHLSTLIEDAQKRKQIAKAAKHEVEKKWDLDKHWRDFEKVYLEVVNKK